MTQALTDIKNGPLPVIKGPILSIKIPKPISKETNQKLTLLKENLKKMDSVLIAFSGGVDSAFLSAVAFEVLGSNALSLTAVSPTLASSEKEDAVTVAKLIGIKHILVQSNEMDIENFSTNPVDRCYYCKSELYDICLNEARTRDIINILDGFNFDDNEDIRYGKKAAVEREINSPLNDAGLTKDEIRAISYAMNLPTWNKAELACLSSRIPTGVTITDTNLRKIEDGESFLKSLGLTQVRLRFDNNFAKIEALEDEFHLLFGSNRKRILDELSKLGFKNISIDLNGYKRIKKS